MERTFFAVWIVCLSVCQCRQQAEVTSGTLQSPDYPKPYPPNLMKQWHLSAPEGFRIQLKLTHVDINPSRECSLDSLTVKHGETISKICGQNLTQLSAEPITSEGKKMTIIFQTSDFNPEFHQHTGFLVNFKKIDVDECSKADPKNGSGSVCSQMCVNTVGSYYCSCYSGYTLQPDHQTCLLSCNAHIFKQEGRLSSPRYPDPSPPNLSCTYVISVEDHFTVTLNFTDFHVHSEDGEDAEDGPRCLHHWLQVTVPDSEPMMLCGGRSPGVIATDSRTIRLDYKTGDEGLSRGWSLSYSSSASGCEEPEPLLNGGVILLSGSQNQQDSVIQYHCNEPFYSFPWGENVTFTCEADRKWRSVHQDLPLTCTPVCGKPTRIIADYERILGGREAPAGAVPWQVLLNIEGVRVGGVVVAERWILTAAHDLKHSRKSMSSEAVQVHLGHTNLKALLKSPVLAASVHIHPEYNNSDGLDRDNDIALIRLQKPLTFNAAIMPICLPAENRKYVAGMMGVASGFGIVDIYPPRIPKNLNYAELPVVDQETCRHSFTELKKRRHNLPRLTDNMFCVGLPEGGQSSCLGDNGGPFALSDDGQFWAAGIDSWGVDCGKQGTYRVYTKVANYLDWINQTIHDNGGF
ncbi:complement C1r subcomponent-like protein [Takifugu flavidus]|uniref:complement subcomponent C1r n=1 Tax=Takifugu flavidus TaxID=433684 RepID=A0A5C6PGX4_9TELE|nr:complement C1r subcomponent-like protein [Takifugu flavidus]TWW79042.1 Complement C1s subcomponent [Takifugu flavidus]